MRAREALSIAELHKLARRRLPRILFDVIESGTEGEVALFANEASFGAWRLLARCLVDVATRDQSLELLGRRHASPFGIGPTGYAGLFRPGADFMLARAAKAADIPFVLSGASVAALEDVAREAPDHLWYHLYAAKDPAISRDLLARASAVGIGTLMLTVDNPVLPKRERDMRNGFVLPLRLKPAILLEAMRHPGWIVDYYRHGGLPKLENWARYAPAGADAGAVGHFFRQQSPSIQIWATLAEFRRIWPGKLVLKGIQHPDDAVRAVAEGVDGVIVSNHGGKAYDMLPTPLFSLAAVKAAVGGRIPVMFDSGVRRGSDILIARALGADFVFVGRATLYGAVAGGQEGADRAVEILRDEVDRGLAMIGCPRIADLDGNWLAPASPSAGADGLHGREIAP